MVCYHTRDWRATVARGDEEGTASTMSRGTRWSRIGVLLLALLTLGACGDASPPVPIPQRTPPRPVASATTPSATPRQGGRATVGVVCDLRTIDPAFAPVGLAATLFRPVVEGLFDFDADGQPHPWLAEAVPARGHGVSDDGTVVIVHLRQGVAWEDGSAFTANDVLFTLAAARDPDNAFAPEVAAAYATIRTVDALDPYTVRLALVAPGDAYLRAFAPVFPAHLFNGHTGLANSPYARAPFGTGPFRLADWTPGEALLLTRSTSYRLPDRPRLDTILFLAFPEQGAAEAALREGRIDLLLTPDGATLLTPADHATALRDLAPTRGIPPTWSAAEWWRQDAR